MINTEPGKARLTSTCHCVSSDVIGFHLGHYEGAVTLAGNHALNQFFGTAFTVIPRCVNQRHPSERPVRNASSSSDCRMSSLPDTRRALADRRDNGRVAKLNSLGCALVSHSSQLN